MTIIVFLVDTSASMNQRAYLGGRPTMIDVAKGAVESFVKLRSRSIESRYDRYMLLTFEEPPNNIKAGWKESLQTFMTELKNLQSTSLTTMGTALKQTFDVLNINRMQSGIDTYGQGRCPYYLEPSVIIVITDGGKLSTMQSVQEDFNLPMNNPIPGSELTREPFRWDQRLFALVLRMTGTPPIDRDSGLVPSDSSPIDAMCEVTGGRSYSITSHRMLHQCIDSLVQKVQSGVVIHFEKIGPDPPPMGNVSDIEALMLDNGESPDDSLDLLPTRIPSRPQTPTTGLSNNQMGTAWHNCRKLIYVPRSAQKGFPVGHWPIPENFWPELSASVLPPRTAHPNVKFTCTAQEPLVIENVPFDKYELEPSPLTQYILSRKQPTICWQVFVANSYKNTEVGHPFGYLKASTNLACVNLFVMPYNYPQLLPLLDELFKVHRMKPSPEWRMQFNNYLRTMPAYYVNPLRRALQRVAGQQLTSILMPENMENGLSYPVMNYLKRLKNQAKLEYEKLCADVGKTKLPGAALVLPEGIRVQSRAAIKKELVSHPLLQDKFSHLREQIAEFPGFVIGSSAVRVSRSQSYRNPFDVPRRSLLDQLVRMRSNFSKPPNSGHSLLHDDDEAHSMPVSQMGNYQEYLKRIPAQLREIESAPVRQHMFGNPFKIDKRMMVDEADMDLPGAGGGGGGARKRAASESSPAASPRAKGRKPGPIPRDVLVRRPSTPTPSPPASPTLAPSIPFDFTPSLVAAPVSPVSPVIPVVTPVPATLPISPVAEPEVVPIEVLPSKPTPLVNGNTEHVDRHVRSPSPEIICIPEPVAAAAAIVPPTDVMSNHVPVAAAVPNHINDSPTRPETKVSPVPIVPTAAETAAIKRHNIQLRSLAYKEVRRPGKDFNALMNHMKSAKGDLDAQRELIKDVINESLRFKRKRMAAELESFLSKLSDVATPPLNGQAAS
ncbi:integrator complex subunit 6-B [Neocloeon triangulifer]|uniref:integrator complex subunit 6-B n=1 Tax=Neocloeon triangulifer TaxID=2078957 RepID=UPI00286F416C|nr:integrator complex subunit 6-B [Neocloeon triangulifer]XP_059483948.1 integrator complex subunit 6-B [Neocloeon triangulifer]